MAWGRARVKFASSSLFRRVSACLEKVRARVCVASAKLLRVQASGRSSTGSCQHPDGSSAAGTDVRTKPSSALSQCTHHTCWITAPPTTSNHLELLLEQQGRGPRRSGPTRRSGLFSALDNSRKIRLYLVSGVRD